MVVRSKRPASSSSTPVNTSALNTVISAACATARVGHTIGHHDMPSAMTTAIRAANGFFISLSPSLPRTSVPRAGRQVVEPNQVHVATGAVLRGPQQLLDTVETRLARQI